MSANPQLAPATHIVIKPFTGPGSKEFKAGDHVYASEWPKLEKLVAQRYLRPIGSFEDRSDAARLQGLEQELLDLRAMVESQAKQIAELLASLPKKKAEKVKEVPDGAQPGQ